MCLDNNEADKDDELKYGMTNAYSDLKYNAQYFEQKEEQERNILYSNQTRLSIKKMLKKLEHKTENHFRKQGSLP